MNIFMLLILRKIGFMHLWKTDLIRSYVNLQIFNVLLIEFQVWYTSEYVLANSRVTYDSAIRLYALD